MIKQLRQIFRQGKNRLLAWLDLPARWSRKFVIWTGRRSTDHNLLNRLEGWTSALLIGCLWMIRRPIEKVQIWLSHRKKPTRHFEAKEDLPARRGRNFVIWAGRRSTDRSLLNRLEGWTSALLIGCLWMIRRPIEKIEFWLSHRQKPTRRFEAKEDEAALKLALQKKAAEARRKRELANSWAGRLGNLALVPIRGIIVFAAYYFRTRSLALVWWGIPFFAIVALLLTASSYTLFSDRAGLAFRYERALVDAIKAGNAEQADRFRLKLEQLGVLTDRGEYRVALALEKSGDLTGAYRRMQSLAPHDRPGFPGAHFWIAQNLLDGKLEHPSAEAIPLAIDHFRQLRVQVGSQPDLNFLEAVAHFRLEHFEAAWNLLLQIERRFPAANALLMDICLRYREKDQAREHALALLRQLKQATSEGRELSDDERQWELAAAKLIGDTNAVNTAIESWYRSNPNSLEARANRGILLLRKVDEWLERPDEKTVSATADKLVAAAQMIPAENFQLVKDRLTYLIRNKSKSPALEQLYANVVANAGLPVLAIEHFGALAAIQQEWVMADQLLSRALQVDPQLAVGWNNRAYVLNAAFPKRRMEALDCATRAVEIDSINPDFRETRGMIYFKLKRWDEAIADLEIAANGVRDLDSIHLALAECFQQTGRPDLAEIYRQQVKKQ